MDLLSLSLWPFSDAVLLSINTAYANLVEGHLRNICTKLSCTLTSRFRKKNITVNVFFFLPAAAATKDVFKKKNC